MGDRLASRGGEETFLAHWLVIVPYGRRSVGNSPWLAAHREEAGAFGPRSAACLEEPLPCVPGALRVAGGLVPLVTSTAPSRALSPGWAGAERAVSQGCQA